ncbi:hypothetical protein AM593_05287, partial [Mytilus galloprovincialis]
LLRNKWTSFQKARLDCFIPGNLPVCFDSIQDVTMRDNVFYGLFTTTTGLPASAICAFNLTSIDAVLDGSFTEQSSPNAFWTEVTTVPTPRPGQDDSVFIGTDSSVTRIRVINCEKYYWIDDCVKDPHCGWDNVTALPDLQFFNRCRAIEYLKENDLLVHPFNIK